MSTELPKSKLLGAAKEVSGILDGLLYSFIETPELADKKMLATLDILRIITIAEAKAFKEGKEYGKRHKRVVHFNTNTCGDEIPGNKSYLPG